MLLGRIDVRSGFDGIEPGLEQLLRLEGGGLTVLNRAGPLYACHDKLATAVALHSAGIRHPETAVLASPTNRPIFEGPFMVKPRFGSCWGHDAFLCPTDRSLKLTLASLRKRSWFETHGVLVHDSRLQAGII